MKHESFEPKGSFFMLNENVQLGHGDCLELMKAIPDSSVDLILADPPYGTTACKWDSVIPFDLMWNELRRIIKPNGAIIMFGSQPFTSALVMSQHKLFRCEWIWRKTRPTGNLNAKRIPLKSHESILVFSLKPHKYYPIKTIAPAENIDRRKNVRPSKVKAGGIYNNSKEYKNYRKPDDGTRYPISVQEFKNPNNNLLHPTQKPVALLEYLIKTYTQEGETVLDFTMGSGSTGVAALNTKRKFIGIELDQKYFDIAKERISCVMQSDLLQ